MQQPPYEQWQQPPWQPNQPPPYQQQPMYYLPPQQPYFQPPPMMMVQPPPKRRLHGCLIAAVVFIALGICGMIMNMFSGPQSSSTSTTPTAQVTDTPLTDMSDIESQVQDDINNANLQGDYIAQAITSMAMHSPS